MYLPELPFDVLLKTLQYLSISDIYALRSTCKSLVTATNERYLWLDLNLAINAIVPNPGTIASLPELPTPELRACAVKSLKLDSQWPRSDTTPRLITSMLCDFRISGLALVPGGKWILMLLDTSDIRLQSFSGKIPALNMRIPYSTKFGERSLHMCDDGHFIIVSRESSNRSEVLVYHMDARKAGTISLLSTFHVPFAVYHCASFKGKKFALGGVRQEDGAHLIQVRTIHPIPSQHEETTFLTALLLPATRVALKFLSEDRLFLAFAGGIMVFGIPELEPALAYILPIIHEPLWEFTIGMVSYSSSPAIGRTVRSRQDPHIGRFAVWFGGMLYMFSFSPDTDMYSTPKPTIVARNSEEDMVIIGSRRAVWSSPNFDNFRTFTFALAKSDEPAPPFRGAPLKEEFQMGSLNVGGLNSGFEFMGFDEESGRVCGFTFARLRGKLNGRLSMIETI